MEKLCRHIHQQIDEVLRKIINSMSETSPPTSFKQCCYIIPYFIISLKVSWSNIYILCLEQTENWSNKDFLLSEVYISSQSAGWLDVNNLIKRNVTRALLNNLKYHILSTFNIISLALYWFGVRWRYDTSSLSLSLSLSLSFLTLNYLTLFYLVLK